MENQLIFDNLLKEIDVLMFDEFGVQIVQQFLHKGTLEQQLFLIQCISDDKHLPSIVVHKCGHGLVLTALVSLENEDRVGLHFALQVKYNPK